MFWCVVMKKSLNNLLRRLLTEGKLKAQVTDRMYLNGLLVAAERNFRVARDVKTSHSEAAFKAAYDGLLQVSRVIVLMNGYRPHDGGQHHTTFMVAGAFLGDEFARIVRKIDRYRNKRNACVYHPIMNITSAEATNIIATAGEYWHIVRKYLATHDPQLELFDFSLF
jgi:hypothetical protein